MRVQATECAFEVDDEWKDESSYLFVDGDVHVVTGRFAPKSQWPNKLDEALERFARGAPGYRLLGRTELDRPARGAQRVTHVVGGGYPIVEAGVFWPLGDDIWMLRVTAPREAQDRCEAVLEGFLRSYRPMEDA